MVVRLREELSDLEQLALVPVSYSRLDTYFSASFGCKAKYFYQYIAKEPRGFGSAALLGNVVHQALENTLKPSMKIDEAVLEELNQQFHSSYEELDLEGIITQDQIQAGIQMLQEFVDRHEGDVLPEQLHNELSFEVVIGSALIRGFIDKIEVLDDTVHITDFKTGSYEVAKKDVAKNLQLGLYAVVARKLFPGKKVYAELYYLKSGRQKGHLFSDDDLFEVETNLTSLVNELLVRQNYDYTPNARTCYSCDYAKTVCPMGLRRVRH